MKKANSVLGSWKTKCPVDPQSAPFCKAETVPVRRIMVVVEPSYLTDSELLFLEVARDLDRDLGLVPEKVLQPA